MMASLVTKHDERTLFIVLVVVGGLLLNQLALVSAADQGEDSGKSTTLDSFQLREKLKATGALNDEQISAICDSLDSFDSSKQDDCGQAKFTELNDQIESNLYGLDLAKADKVRTPVFRHLINLFKGCAPYLEDNIKKTVDDLDVADRNDVCKINDYIGKDYYSETSFFSRLPDLKPREQLILGTLAYVKDSIDLANAEVPNNPKMFAIKYKNVVARPCSTVWKALKFALLITDHADTDASELNDFSKKWIAMAKTCRDLVAYMESYTEKMYKHRNRNLQPRKSASNE